MIQRQRIYGVHEEGGQGKREGPCRNREDNRPLEEKTDKVPAPEENDGKKDEGAHCDGKIALPEPPVDPDSQAGTSKDPVQQGDVAQELAFEEIGKILVLEAAYSQEGKPFLDLLFLCPGGG